MSDNRGMLDLFKNTPSDGLLNFTKLYWVINVTLIKEDKGDAVERANTYLTNFQDVRCCMGCIFLHETHNLLNRSNQPT